MRTTTLLMTPGPTNIPDDVYTILATPKPHHRSHAFAKVFQTMRQNLKTILQCRNGEVITFASSGTGVMEAAMVNFNMRNAHVLVVETGYFGTRFTELAKTYQLNVTRLSFSGGNRANVEMIRQALLNDSKIKTVYVTHHDTSTGVCNDIQQIGEMLKEFPNVLFVIDSISGMIMHEVRMDDWNIDVVLGASQKGFMVPPGLAFLCLNEKALQRIQNADLPRFYFDIPKQVEMLEMNQTFATPAIPLIFAMEYMTSKICNQGIEQQYEIYAQRRRKLEQLLLKNGFELVVKKEENKGNVVVPLYIPNTLTPKQIVDYMEKNSNIMIIGGYGELKMTTVRIGVLGPIKDSDIEDTVRALVRAVETLQKEVL